MEFPQELGQALPRCSKELFESAAKKRKGNMPVGDAIWKGGDICS
jgi:hypothetical protein